VFTDNFRNLTHCIERQDFNTNKFPRLLINIKNALGKSTYVVENAKIGQIIIKKELKRKIPNSETEVPLNLTQDNPTLIRCRSKKLDQALNGPHRMNIRASKGRHCSARKLKPSHIPDSSFKSNNIRSETDIHPTLLTMEQVTMLKMTGEMKANGILLMARPHLSNCLSRKSSKTNAWGKRTNPENIRKVFRKVIYCSKTNVCFNPHSYYLVGRSAERSIQTLNSRTKMVFVTMTLEFNIRQAVTHHLLLWSRKTKMNSNLFHGKQVRKTRKLMTIKRWSDRVQFRSKSTYFKTGIL
jgi:hypothetical protein